MTPEGAATERVSVVLPTYNRADALRETFPRLLEVAGVCEIVVVDDASSDDTAEFLATQTDPRVRVLRHERRRGSPAGRNTGVEASSGDWVLFGEDDCVLPRDYATTLLDQAARSGADVIAAPWLRCELGGERAAVEKARATAADRITLHTHPQTMPRGNIETPFLPALALVRRSVFERVRFDESYTGTAYREETDFFVSAVRLGFRCVLTSATAHFQHRIWLGGQKRARLRYEASVLRNNWRFLRRHGRWLREGGHIRGRWIEQVRFTVRLAQAMVVGAVRARVGDSI